MEADYCAKCGDQLKQSPHFLCRLQCDCGNDKGYWSKQTPEPRDSLGRKHKRVNGYYLYLSLKPPVLRKLTSPILEVNNGKTN